MASESKFHGDDRWTLMFRELKKEVSKPTKDHPTARVWRRSDLTTVITNIHKREFDQLKSTFPPAKNVIARMLDIGWIQPIPLESKTDKKAPSLFLLDMEASEEEFPEPWELLQAFKPAGVICYLGAASFHELTTQVPTFYHIANLRPPTPDNTPDEVQSSETSSNQTDQKRDPLGSFGFRFDDSDYYTTSRDESTIPGWQTRTRGPRTNLRITTVEQTILDTLWQPLKFGGESIAFEVWERGVQVWNPDKMAKHLGTINRQDWIRRVGAMLSLLGVKVEGDLKELLQKSSLNLSGHEIPLALLPDLPATNLIKEWGILTP